MREEINGVAIPAAIVPFRPEMAFPYLTAEMMERLGSYGRVEQFVAGTQLWERGQREVNLFVMIAGELEITTPTDEGPMKVIATMGPGQFSGELDLLSTRPTLVNGRVKTDSTMLVIPRPELQRLMRAEGDIANLIMQAVIWRRLGILERGAGGLVLLGHGTSADTILLQRFLTRNSYPFRLLEPTAEQAANAEASTAEEHLLPVVMFADGTILHRPTISELADRLGMTEKIDAETTYDLTVVGAGPSGLATAVYGASEGLSTLVVEGVLRPADRRGRARRLRTTLGFRREFPVRSWRTGRGCRRRSLARGWRSRASVPAWI